MCVELDRLCLSVQTVGVVVERMNAHPDVVGWCRVVYMLIVGVCVYVCVCFGDMSVVCGVWWEERQ